MEAPQLARCGSDCGSHRCFEFGSAVAVVRGDVLLGELGDDLPVSELGDAPAHLPQLVGGGALLVGRALRGVDDAGDHGASPLGAIPAASHSFSASVSALPMRRRATFGVTPSARPMAASL